MQEQETSDGHMKDLILASEREAQMVSAFARLLIIMIAIAIFLVAGGTNLPVATAVLTYLGSYAMVSIISAILSLERFFNPRMSLLFTAIDGISLALFVGFVLQVTGSAFSLFGAVPGFFFVFPILILATMRYTIGPVLVTFFSFTLTWFLFSILAVEVAPQTASDPNFFFGTVQNAARWGFLAIATILGLLAVIRRRRTLETAIIATNRTANLSRYLPDRIANVVAEQGIGALTSGQRQEATILFVDIRGFTGISEQLQPEELGVLLSEFRSTVSAAVDAHSGIVDKFIGDAVMVVFGVLDQKSNHKENGVKCALAILEKLKTKNEARKYANPPEINVTIGVHSGIVYAGAVGTENRMEFTVLGDTVNIAARLQEVAKSSQSGLVVSQDSLGIEGCASGENQSWKALSETRIKGRQGKVLLFEYMGQPEHHGL